MVEDSHGEKLKKQIEELASKLQLDSDASVNEKQVAKFLDATSGGFSGSLTDYMFGSKIERPTIIIGTGDTLVSIAESLFRDRKIGFLIAEINRDRTNQYIIEDRTIVEASAKDVMKLPLKEDITEFESRDNRNLDPDKLVTIVSEKAVNKRLIDKVLKPVVEPSIDWPKTNVESVQFKKADDRIKFKQFRSELTNQHNQLRKVVLNGIKLNRSIDK